MISQLDNRLVGFFDVLGFSARLKMTALGPLHSAYAALLDGVNERVFQQIETVASSDDRPEQQRAVNNFALTYVVSDSLFLISHDVADVTAVSRFVMAALLLMEEAFAAHFPLRGAIAIGDVLHDDKRGVLLSPVIPDLVNAEKVQDWSGCHILESAERLVGEALCGARFVGMGMPAEARHPIIAYHVPTKEDCPETGRRLCLNWPYMLGDDQLTTGLAFLRGRKGEETARFLRAVFDLPNQAQMLTAEYAPASYVRMRVTRSQMMVRLFNSEHRQEPVSRPIK